VNFDSKGLKGSIFTGAILLLFLGSYFLLHLYFLEADTPVSLTYGAGTYCDEGYKTLDARNMVLFDKTHWTDLDNYRGWIKKSPITVYFNYIMFSTFGVSLATARLGNLFFAMGCLILFYLILEKIYDRRHAFLGIILCGVNQVFFFYSRIALFEFKMIFFVLLGVYFMLYVGQQVLFFIPMIAAWVAAYYCKSSVQMFYISLIIYFSLVYKNGLLLDFLFKKKVFWISAFLLVMGLGILQFFFVFHREFYDSVSLFNRHYRSPAGAAVFWISQEFFTKNPILIFLTLSYSGYIIVQVLEKKIFNRYDLFFMVWLVFGTAMFSLVSFVQLGYYVYLTFPLVILAVRCIFSFPLVIRCFFEEKYMIFKWIIFTSSFVLLITHFSFLSYWPVRHALGWDVRAIRYLAVFSILTFSLLTFLYFFLRRNKRIVRVLSELSHAKYVVFFSIIILFFQIVPISKWALNPKYELMDIYEKMNEFEKGSIFAGDWAPQLCIDTPHRVLYTVTTENFSLSRNFFNLDLIKPDYLVIVDELNDRILHQFNLEYPGVAKEFPHSSFKYAGRSIKFYELDFN
jgi:hypothetical protein